LNKNFYLLLLFIISSIHANATAEDTLVHRNISGVVVSTYRIKTTRQTSYAIQPIDIDSLSAFASYNLTELLAKTPGVSMLSSGIGISKPVIRGLYGNRILVLLSGLKFDNQQWQEEHGLGLSSFGISRVELIKGPMGTLYGSEAIGGVINLIDEEKAPENSTRYTYGLKINSNTLGGLVQFGIKKHYQNKWSNIRIGIENNADYTDGNSNRILNSRFNGYYLKSSFGFERNKWKSALNFSGSFNQFGFIFNDIYSFISADSRWNRSLKVNPSHNVALAIVSSENSISINNKSNVNINIGVQSNSRMENEGGGAISLNMHLLTFQSLIKYSYSINNQHKIIFSNLNCYEINKNYGARKIVPNARMFETNVSAFLESSFTKKIIFENGIGIGLKNVNTGFTSGLNGPDNLIQTFKKQSPYYNLNSGLTYSPNSDLNLKLNLSTGVRVANLAELSSNGLHEGVFTFEIGNPNMKNEQLLAANLYLNYSKNEWEFAFSPFYNYFLNYIYLSPTNEEWLGFPVYRYLQQNATQYGFETSVENDITEELTLRVDYSTMNSFTSDNGFTPYIPASKLKPNLLYQFKSNKYSSWNIFTDVEHCFAQNRIAKYELKTPSYTLWNAGISLKKISAKKEFNFSLVINNILNKTYYDHLSRFKYFGLNNPGRNLTLSIIIK